jgi:hypothetical protein
MPTTTPHLGLALYNSTTDQAETFLNFRLAIAGNGAGSNMDLIDDWAVTVDASLADLGTFRGAIPVDANYISANTYEVGSVTAITAYTVGLGIALSVDTTTSGSATLNINSLGAKSLMKVNNAGAYVNLSGSDLKINKTYYFIYDGTRFVWIGATTGDQINIEGTSGNVVTVNSDNTFLGTTTPAGLVGTTIYGASNKSTLVDADTIGITNSASGNAIAHITWADFKTNLPPSSRSWFGV